MATDSPAAPHTRWPLDLTEAKNPLVYRSSLPCHIFHDVSPPHRIPIHRDNACIERAR